MHKFDSLMYINAYVFKKNQLSEFAFLENLIFKEGCPEDVVDEYKVCNGLIPIEPSSDSIFIQDAVGFEFVSLIGDSSGIEFSCGVESELEGLSIGEIIEPYVGDLEKRVHQMLDPCLDSSKMDKLSKDVITLDMEPIRVFDHNSDIVRLLTAWDYSCGGGGWNAFGSDDFWSECHLLGFVNVRTLEFTPIEKV